MTLAARSRFGPYEIVAPIGAGGMGEVYRARDTRLDRTVAIKVLLPHVAADPAFRQRFEREAKTISSLDHPHICALYDFGHDQGSEFLVMQYLEGETLADRVAKGPLPLEQALKHACEIADALDRAHRQGIVHRDLKPGNVMLTKTGAKLLDFGLAKAAGAAVAATGATMTATGPVTAEGAILGTLQYMAPEQLEGKEADARSDIWALGCVLYEMFTGRRAFESRSQATLVAAILEHEPTAVSQLASVAPAALDHLVRRCLAKDPDERWASAHDVLLELKWIAEGGAIAAPAASTVRRWRERLLVSLLALTIGAAVLVGLVHMRETPAPPVHAVFESRLPADVTFASWENVALSPDRRSVVFPAERGGMVQLFLRSLHSLQISAVPGTEGGSFPFWSPDSSQVAFSAQGKLKRVTIAGGAPVDVCDATVVSAGSWNAAGVIIFASHGGIYRVPAAGGPPERITLDAGYTSPIFLPDGRRFLARGSKDGVYAGALDQSTTVKVADGADAPKIALAVGHLLFMRRGSLLAQPFDVAALKPTGAPRTIAEDVRWNAFAGAMFAVENDVLVFSGGPSRNRLRWMARSGAPLGYAGEAGPYSHFRIAPSGTKIAVQHSGDLWLLDVTTDVMTRLTSDPAHDADPAWSPDERRIVFTSMRTGRLTIFEKDLTTGVEWPLLVDPPPPGAVVDDWSPDGRWVIFRNIGPLVYGLPMDGERKPRLIGDTQGSAADSAHLSSDGRWLAFTEDATGRAEVSIARFPDFTDKRQVSRGGGMQPMWRRDGKELFYLGTDAKIYAVPIQDGTSQIAGAPVPLFETRIRPDSDFDQYGVVDNGQRFLVLEPEQPSESLTFVLDWTARVRPR